MKRTRIVLDTNVIISGLLFGGLPGILIKYVMDGSIELAITPTLEAELERVLQTKFPHTQTAIHDTLEVLREIAIRVVPTEKITLISEDPDDNAVLECAVSARADVIVSGDNHLLLLKKFRHIWILSPRKFLAKHPRKER